MDPMMLANLSSIADSVGKFANTGVQLWQQNKTWQREDNAVQRRVADLKKAGLSPVLAAGSAAETSAPIRVGFPTDLTDTLGTRADISRTQAQKDLTRQQATNAGITKRILTANAEEAGAHALSAQLDAALKEKTQEYNVRAAEQNLKALQIANMSNARDLELITRTGLTSHAGAVPRAIGEGKLMIEKFGHDVKSALEDLVNRFKNPQVGGRK